MSVLYNTDTLHSILALYVLLNLLMPFLNLLMPLFQPPDATFSIFQECQSCESEVLVWVSPNHSSSTRDLEKPILALPLHGIGPLLYLCLHPRSIHLPMTILHGSFEFFGVIINDIPSYFFEFFTPSPYFRVLVRAGGTSGMPPVNSSQRSCQYMQCIFEL